MPQDSKAGRTHSNISSKPTPQGVNWLLVIAIDEYQHCAKLRNCVNDAKKVTKVLQEKYQFEQVVELYNEAATKTNIVSKLNELSERIRRDVDNLVLYFSGHGETEGDDEEDEQIGYLIPVEAARGDESQYIPHVFFRSKLNRIRTKHTFVIIDACFAGSFFYNLRSERRSGSENLPSRWGISSSSSHEVALDGAPGDNSPFAICLLAALEANDTPLGIHGLAAEIENRMQSQSAMQTTICLPFSDPNRYNGQFYFHPKQNEASAWAQAQREDAIAAYEAFLSKFPNGSYAPEAQKRLNQLKDDAFWQAVNHIGTESAFLDYYERGSDFTRKQEAYRNMQRLDEEKAWRIAALRDSIPAYLEYLQKHPNGAHAPDARKRMDALRVPEPPSVEPTYASPVPKMSASNKPKVTTKQKQSNNDKPFPWRGAGIGGALLLVAALMIWQPWRSNNTNTPAYIESQMVFVKGGTFQMGSNDGKNNEKPVHTVTVSDFYIGKYEVTQAQWRAVMGSDPPNLNFKGCDQCPVEGVSWNDIQDFLKKLNAKTGKNYRLPTEAEWEYAARGGAKSKGYKYAGGYDLDKVAWYESNSNRKTHPVGGKAPNELGLYDMSGNVYEWVQDCGNDSYQGAPTNGSAWLKGDCARRVVRGGSWYFYDSDCRVSNRDRSDAGSRNFDIGFRLAGY